MSDPSRFEVSHPVTDDEVAAVVAALTALATRPRRPVEDNYAKWRRVRQFTVAQALR
jgi:hypothetical protein